MAYSLAWDSYKSNLSAGFSSLQQNGEFVDMTLAADGHLVKCHQVVVALASPYLKDMITSASCPHPVVYLNNISHRVLGYILEYIYTGETTVTSECLTEFTEAACSLRIRGLENISKSNDYMRGFAQASVPRSMPNDYVTTHTVKRKAPIETYDQQLTLPSTPRKIFIKSEGPISMDHMQPAEMLDDFGDSMELDHSLACDSDEELHVTPIISMDESQVKSASNLLFTVSIRGSLQAILNRYIYNLHTSTSKNGTRRWRCVDYRDNKCTAFIVTKGNVVVHRANVHTHPFHDKKILVKLEKKSVFSALDEVEAFKEKEEGLDKAAQFTLDEDLLDSFTRASSDD